MTDTTFDQYKATPFEAEEAKFFSFVNEQIEKMQRYSDIDINNLSFDQLNRQLGQFNNIYLSLLSLKAFSDTQLKKDQMEFDQWYAPLYVAVRAKHNRSELAANKWLGKAEIDIYIQTENKEEYTKWNYALMLTEGRIKFIDNLIKSWETHSRNLGTLSKNIQTETSLAFKSN